MYVDVKYVVLPRKASAGDFIVSVVPDIDGAVGVW